MAEAIGAARVELSANAAQFENDMKRARRAVNDNARGMRREFDQLKRTVDDSVASLFTLRGAAVAAAGLGGLLYLTKRAIETADAIGKTSKAAGVTAEELQELRFAAGRSGVETSVLEQSLLAFTKRLGEAKQGTGEAKDALERLGISMSSLQSKTPVQALEIVADRLSKVRDVTERNAIASDLFSRAGIEMVNMLADGSAGLQELRQRAHEVGFVLSNDTVAAAEEANDRIEELTEAFGQLGTIVALKAAPALTQFAIALRQMLAGMTLDEQIAAARKEVERLSDETLEQERIQRGANREYDEAVKRLNELLAVQRSLALLKHGDLAPSPDEFAGVGSSGAPLPAMPPVPGAKPAKEALAAQRELAKEGAALAKTRDEQIAQAMRHVEAIRQERQASLDALSRIDDAWLQSTGRQVALIRKRKEEQLKALEDMALTEQEKAAARVQINEAAEAQLAELRTRSNETAIAQTKDLIDWNQELNLTMLDVTDTLADGERGWESWARVAIRAIDRVLQASGVTGGIAGFLAQIIQGAITPTIGAARLPGQLPGTGGVGAGLGSHAKGAAFDSPVIPFAKGGTILRKPTMFGLAGEAGPEAILPLKRINGQLGVSAEGTGAHVEINIVNNNSDNRIRQEERRSGNGQRQIIITIDKVLGDMAARGEGKLFNTIQKQFGAQVAPVKR